MNLERIEVTPFTTILAEIIQTRLSGCLTIVRAPSRLNLYWAQGDLALVVSSMPEESFGQFLLRKGVLGADAAKQLDANPIETVPLTMQSTLLDSQQKELMLREWMLSLTVPLFSLNEGTAFFNDDQPLPPEQRIYVQSVAAVVMQGVRSISNGLVLRKALGDIKREITRARGSRFEIETLPLTEAERVIAQSLHAPLSIESFLKQFSGDSMNAARVIIGMNVLGVFTDATATTERALADGADMQRELTLLASIGNDPRLLKVVSFARRLPALDHYQALDVPRAATRAQIVTRVEELKTQYDPALFPPIVREQILEIRHRIDEAFQVLADVVKRPEYDQLLVEPTRGNAEFSVQQRLARHAIAEQNFARAQQLVLTGDYYGAIMLLQSTVDFAPSNAEAWYLLATCQERNPKWRYQAVESYQKALAVDPNHVDALIGLGDLFQSQGLLVRAENCYQDALKIQPDNVKAKGRLKTAKK